jgi:2-succinyl-6-hydroxy-2,4-cyclohexadiene-1-carboxylate synthase
MSETVILLHGFAGTGRMWDPVIERLDGERYRALAPDLRGHGSASARRPVTFAGCVQDVLRLVSHESTLVGYSMGGRVALHVALAAPERFDRLVLVSTTAGIGDASTRAARVDADEELAQFAEREGIEAFADRWAAQPLFAGTPPAVVQVWRADMLDNDPAALAASLRGMGSGAMEPLWDRLGELGMPATVVVGERDARFVAFGGRLAAGLPDARLHVIHGGRHGLPREAPSELAAAIAQPR